MSETPIIRLAAWLYAQSACHLPVEDPMFKDELSYFYEQNRSCKYPNWTMSWIGMAKEAYFYMKEERM